MPKFKNSNATFWVIFKHCAVDEGKIRIFFNFLHFTKRHRPKVKATGNSANRARRRLFD